MSTFLLNFRPSDPKFLRRHCTTGLERNSFTRMKLCPSFPPPPEPKSWSRYWFLGRRSKEILMKNVLYFRPANCNETSASRRDERRLRAGRVENIVGSRSIDRQCASLLMCSALWAALPPPASGFWSSAATLRGGGGVPTCVTSEA